MKRTKDNRANPPDHVASAIERALRGNGIQESALRNLLEKRLRELRQAAK